METAAEEEFRDFVQARWQPLVRTAILLAGDQDALRTWCSRRWWSSIASGGTSNPVPGRRMPARSWSTRPHRGSGAGATPRSRSTAPVRARGRHAGSVPALCGPHGRVPSRGRKNLRLTDAASDPLGLHSGSW